MKVYLKQNVFDAALDRIRWLFDEFENVAVNFSGGKDSTVVLNLCLRVAEERGRLPLTVVFVDQEAEWQTVIDYIRDVMDDPRVEPAWLQVPFKITNATSPDDPWLHAWEPGKEDQWMRPKEPDSIHENQLGVVRFHDMFNGYLNWRFKGQKAVNIAGVKCCESPARMKGLTSFETYKGATWGKVENKKKQQFTMYPIYDWDDSDVWKAIHSNGWEYCRIYDYQYQHGVPFREMRVSNLHHETAIKTLYYLQEIEQETWNKLAHRLRGINTLKHLREDFFVPKELPFMFKDWWEYRDYLLEHLIENRDHRERFRRTFAADDARYEDEVKLALVKIQISAILVNDYEGTKMQSFTASHGQYSKNGGKKGGLKFGKYKQNANAKGNASSPAE